MHKPIVWSTEHDAAIISMRAQNLSWDHISSQLGYARYTVSERGRAIGAASPIKAICSSHDDDRQPLPAGSLVTWGSINSGTSIEGDDYPLPGVRA